MFHKLASAFESNSKNLANKPIFSNSMDKKIIGLPFSSNEEKQPVETGSHVTQQNVNPSRPNPERRERLNLNFSFSYFFVVPQKVL